MIIAGECNRADGQGSRYCEQEELWLLYGEAQQVGCLQGLVSNQLEWVRQFLVVEWISTRIAV